MSRLCFATILFAFLFSVLALGSGGGCWAKSRTSSFAQAPFAKPLPQMDVMDAANRPHSLRALAAEKGQGRPILFLFWMASCVPCVNELPLLDAALEEPDTVPVPIPIAIAPQGDIQVPFFLRRRHLSHIAPLWVPSLEALRPLAPIPGVPFGILADAKGREIGRGVGMFLWENDDLQDCLDALR